MLSKNYIAAAGLLFRLLTILLFTENFVTNYYLPFLSSVSQGVDPWSEWIEKGNNPYSFPYGIVLFILLYPIAKILTLLDLTSSVVSANILFGSLYLIFDIYIFKEIRNIAGEKASYLYFLSPLVIYVTYVYKQTDIFVCLLMLLTGINLIQKKEVKAGIFLGLAIGAKFGVALVLPFFIIYSFANGRLRANLFRTVCVATLVAAFNYIPLLWSKGFSNMVFGTRERYRLTDLYLQTGNVRILIFPALYILLTLWIWRTGRANIQVLLGFVGVALFILGITSAQTIGWTLWGFALLLVTISAERKEFVVIFFILQMMLITRDITTDNFQMLNSPFKNLPQAAKDTVITATLTIGFIWCFSSLRRIIEQSDVLKLSTKPLSIAIAGDSGVGKDTICDCFEKLFSTNNFLRISGDSYHKYERGDDRWIKNTHLNPRENFLFRWRQDLDKALRRREFVSRTYDHTFGRFSDNRRVGVADLIVSQGLHALFSYLQDEIDLKVYIEMEDDLRVHFKLNRDTKSRRQNVSTIMKQIRNRREDFVKYIAPQRDKADVSIFLSSSNISVNGIDSVDFTFRELHSAEFLYISLRPFVPNCQLVNTANGGLRIKVPEVNRLSEFVLMRFLHTSAPEIVAMCKKDTQLESKSTGLVTAVLLVLLEYHRLNLRNV